MSADECEGLHQLQRTTPDGVPRWNSEGLAFLAEGPDPATGQRRSGRVPVYRAYNNGAARGIDSNHRFVTAIAEIDTLTTKGWSFEGVAFCAMP